MRNKTVKQKGGNYTELNKDINSIIDWWDQHKYYDVGQCKSDIQTLINELKTKQKKQGIFHKQFGYSFRTMYDTNSSKKLRKYICSTMTDIIDCVLLQNQNNNAFENELLQELIRRIYLFEDEELVDQLNDAFNFNNLIKNYKFKVVTGYVRGIDPDPYQGDTDNNEQYGGIKKSRKLRKSRKSRKLRKTKKLKKSRK
jgi:hypothetical protein